jgi:hypothetical protein
MIVKTRAAKCRPYIAALAAVVLIGCGCKGDGKGKAAEVDARASSAAVEENVITEAQELPVIEGADSVWNICSPEPYDAENDICPGGYGVGVPVDNLPADFVSKIDWKKAKCTLCHTFQGHQIYNCILPGANLQQAYGIARKLDFGSRLQPELPAKTIEIPCPEKECIKVIYEYYSPENLYINIFYEGGGNVVVTISKGAGCVELNVTYAWPLDAEDDEDDLD